jgi:hypothetical protein
MHFIEIVHHRLVERGFARIAAPPSRQSDSLHALDAAALLVTTVS